MTVFRSPFLWAVSFFWTLGAFSLGYSAYVSNYPATATAGVTQLSASEWNKMVSALQALDANLSRLSFSGGNVGIWTASPSTTLHLESGVSWPVSNPTKITIGTSSYSAVAGANPKLELFNSSGNVYGLGISGWSFDYMSAGKHSFYYNGTESMRITAWWNVGIWTPSPGERLDIGGGNIKMGYEIVTNDCVGTSVNVCSVNCSSGKYVTGWGCVVDNSTKYVFRTYPSGVSQWTCHSQGNLENAWSILRAYAICSNIR